MQDHDGNDGTMVINARELLTADDCEQIIRCHGCLVGYAWPPEEKPSPAMCQHVKKFAASVRLAALLYGNLGPEEQQWMCEGLRQISQEIAHEGYLTRCGIYTTEDQKRGCVIGFWPIQVQHNGKFRVPRRFADLMSKKFKVRTGNDEEGDEC
jgi:hypothetical protein